jgi:hypothetical protein
VNKKCPKCDQFFKTGDILRALVYVPWVQIASKVSFAFGKPVAIDKESIEHRDCMEAEGNDFDVSEDEN